MQSDTADPIFSNHFRFFIFNSSEKILTSLPSYDERSLLESVARGDETAFRKLFDNWHRFLATHIYRITESKELTEEIVQDVFLKIWLSRETLGEINNFRAYLVTISRNHALNALRKMATEIKNSESWKKEQTESSGEKGVSEKIFYSLIDQAIDKLPERQKQVWILHRQQRLSYKEIASKLNISKETVKTHLALATAAITKFVKENMSILLFLLISSAEKNF